MGFRFRVCLLMVFVSSTAAICDDVKSVPLKGMTLEQLENKRPSHPWDTALSVVPIGTSK